MWWRPRGVLRRRVLCGRGCMRGVVVAGGNLGCVVEGVVRMRIVDCVRVVMWAGVWVAVKAWARIMLAPWAESKRHTADCMHASVHACNACWRHSACFCDVWWMQTCDALR